MSTPSPPARGRPRSAKTAASILEGAYALMASAGLAAATIDAVSRQAKVSKMTIYKWWPDREALVIDAFLHEAEKILPIPAAGTCAERIGGHVASYVAALAGDFGKVQLAVIAECVANGGSAAPFFGRYLAARREALVRIIAAGQAEGTITARAAPDVVYDAVYGALLYRSLFGIAPADAGFGRALAEAILAPPA